MTSWPRSREEIVRIRRRRAPRPKLTDPDAAGVRQRSLLVFTFSVLLLIVLMLLTSSVQCRTHASGNRPITMDKANTPHATILIEDFEGSSPLLAWTLTPSRPEVSATMSLGQGYIGQGVYIGFGVDQSDHWIDFTRGVVLPVEIHAISFWVKSPPDIVVSLLVERELGQYQSFALTRPFQASDEGDWYRQLVRFNVPINVYGVGFRVQRGRSQLEASGEIVIDQIIAHPEPIIFDVDPANIRLLPAEYSAPWFQSIMGADEAQFDGPDEHALGLAEALGVRYLRADPTRWHALEVAPGVYDFDIGDAILAAHEAHGLTSIFGINGGSQFHTGAWNHPPRAEDELAALGEYAGAVAEHYRGRSIIYDVYSEPTNFHSYDPPLTAEEFAAILEVVSQRIRQADPSATIISGGILSYQREYLSGFIGEGSLDQIDGFGVHSYNIGLPESLSESLLMVRSTMSQFLAQPLPVWDTEWGFSSVVFGGQTLAEARRRQARLVARELLSGWANGLRSICYWSFRDRGEDPGEVYDNFGLVDWNYQPKPAYQAVATLAETARGRLLRGIIDGLPEDCYGLKLDGRYDALLALWNAGSPPLTVTVPAETTAVDFLGEAVPLTPAEGKLMLSLTEALGPVYLTCPECSSSLRAIYLPMVARDLP